MPTKPDLEHSSFTKDQENASFLDTKALALLIAAVVASGAIQQLHENAQSLSDEAVNQMTIEGLLLWLVLSAASVVMYRRKKLRDAQPDLIWSHELRFGLNDSELKDLELYERVKSLLLENKHYLKHNLVNLRLAQSALETVAVHGREDIGLSKRPGFVGYNEIVLDIVGRFTDLEMKFSDQVNLESFVEILFPAEFEELLHHHLEAEERDALLVKFLLYQVQVKASLARIWNEFFEIGKYPSD